MYKVESPWGETKYFHTLKKAKWYVYNNYASQVWHLVKIMAQPYKSV